MCNGLLNDVVLAYCCAVCWCGKRECTVRTCWMVWLMMSGKTAKTACVDFGGKVWRLKWAVRQGLHAQMCVWVRDWESERKKRLSDIILPVAVPSTEQHRFESFQIWKELAAWKFCEYHPICRNRSQGKWYNLKAFKENNKRVKSEDKKGTKVKEKNWICVF